MPADFDRDGDLDMVVFSNNQPLLYLENRVGGDRGFSTVRLEDGVTANRFGIGARVTLVAAGRAQMRELHVGSGYVTSPPPEAHFGLGDRATRIERIEVRWPDGEQQVVDAPPANCVLVIRRGEGAHVWSPDLTARSRG